MSFISIEQIKQANSRAGYHFFDRDTMRWFRSRVSETIYGGRIFITSEQDRPVWIDGRKVAAWDGKRRYTVREIRPDGSINTIGEFGQYGTLDYAINAARRAAAS